MSFLAGFSCRSGLGPNHRRIYKCTTMFCCSPWPGSSNKIWQRHESHWRCCTANQSASGDEHVRLKKFVQESCCEFIFNSSNASNFGGVCRRQIRTIRSILSGMLLNHVTRLTTSTLRPFIYEAAGLINSRPLTVEDINDPLTAVLTPNHLLTMKTCSTPPPPGNFGQNNVCSRKRWRQTHSLAEEFWRKWRSQYLLYVQQVRSKWARRLKKT